MHANISNNNSWWFCFLKNYSGTNMKLKLTTMQVIAIISHGSMNPGFFLITPKSIRLLIKMLQPELMICTVKTQETRFLMKSNFCQYASYCSIISGEVGLSSWNWKYRFKSHFPCSILYWSKYRCLPHLQGHSWPRRAQKSISGFGYQEWE